jgi:hypothetical protein
MIPFFFDARLPASRSGSVWERSLTSFEMTNRLLSCHSERKRGIFLYLEPNSGLKMNHCPASLRRADCTKMASFASPTS